MVVTGSGSAPIITRSISEYGLHDQRIASYDRENIMTNSD